ncbi:hypothetical protein [Mycoplasmopsis columboralis]|uniref:Uncharacterized protein n=1 Tax=Mycoplasmopsis columboralis TaxID=171282 RepID=A0A449B6V4_9BACT|nr:hypothetical protein [Mycoplasmopsis columboralis]VEU76285.1 Uncharacterised protein [Mycoplasmopsis columboralis]
MKKNEQTNFKFINYKPHIFTLVFLVLTLIGFTLSLSLIRDPKNTSYAFLMVMPFTWLVFLSSLGSIMLYRRDKQKAFSNFWIWITLVAFVNLFTSPIALGILINTQADKLYLHPYGYVLLAAMNLILLVMIIWSAFVNKKVIRED